MGLGSVNPQVQKANALKKIDKFFAEHVNTDLDKYLEAVAKYNDSFPTRLKQFVKDNEKTNPEAAELVGRALEFYTVVKQNRGETLYYDYRDFRVLPDYLMAIHKSFVNGKIADNKLNDLLDKIICFVTVIVITNNNTKVDVMSVVEKTIYKIIETGNTALLNNLKRI